MHSTVVAGVAVTAATAPQRKVMVHSVPQQTFKQFLSTFTITRSSWTHHVANPRATSRHDSHLLCHQTTGRLAVTAAVVERVRGARAFSSSASAATAHGRTTTTGTTANSNEDTTSNESGSASSTWTAEDPVQLDAPFLDMVRQRLKEKNDTSAYFMHCKEDPIRQAGVFVVSEKIGRVDLFTQKEENPPPFQSPPFSLFPQ